MLHVLARRALVAAWLALAGCASAPASAPEPKEPDDAVIGYPVAIRARMPSEALTILDARFVLDGNPVRGQTPKLPAGKHEFKASVLVAEVGKAGGAARLTVATTFVLAAPATPQVTVALEERNGSGAVEERVAIKAIVDEHAPPPPDPDRHDPENARKAPPVAKLGSCHPMPPVEMLRVGTRAATVTHVCVDAQGLVESVALLKYSSYERWDAAVLEANRRCRYEVKEAALVPFCYVLRSQVAIKP